MTTYYRRQYRSTPKHPRIHGSDYVKCMAATFAAVLGMLVLWILTT